MEQNDKEITELNQTIKADLLETMVILQGTKGQLSALGIMTPDDAKKVGEALDKLMGAQEKAYDMWRKALGINDKAPAVAVDARQYVIRMPSEVKDKQEWIERYGPKVIDNGKQ